MKSFVIAVALLSGCIWAKGTKTSRMSSLKTSKKSAPDHAKVTAQLDPLKFRQEPLMVGDDTRHVGEGYNLHLLKVYAELQRTLLPQTPVTFSHPELRVREDEYVPRQLETVVHNRVPDCRSLYMDFAVDRVLKEGNNRIYLVKEKSTQRPFIYKVYMSPDEYTRELHSFQVLDHQNIIKAVCFHHENVSKRPGIVMQYIKGEDAIRWASKQPYEKLKYVVAQMLSALHHMHRTGMLHADFKAENVIVEDETDRGVLLDFGYTVAIEDGRRGLGTKPYEAPELFGQVPGPIRTGVDMWALGMTIIAMANAQKYGPSYKRSMVHPLVRDKESKKYRYTPIADGLHRDVLEVVSLLLTLNPLEREFITYRQLAIISKKPFFRGVDWKKYQAEFWSDVVEF